MRKRGGLLNCDLNIRSHWFERGASQEVGLSGGEAWNLKSILGYANAYCLGITLAAGESLLALKPPNKLSCPLLRVFQNQDESLPTIDGSHFGVVSSEL